MIDELIDEFSKSAKRYLRETDTNRVCPSLEALNKIDLLDEPLQDLPIEPKDVLALLDRIGSPATVKTSGSRYFGFVTGGALPAALAANLLAGIWDQNAAMEVMSPIGAAIEEICRKWLLSVLGLPLRSSIGYVTGATMGNFTCLAAARHALLDRVGWNVEDDGLFGAPPITVIVGEEVHVSVLKALSMLGLGRNRTIRIPVDHQGRMLPEKMPEFQGPTILCVQAGNVNTGAFDPMAEIIRKTKKTNVWIHVDGAFGLWAAASPNKRYLVQGIDNADSWATDAHKWLNVPYDSGLAIVRDRQHLLAAMSAKAAYLLEGDKREPCYFVPELSRRARGIEIWAALHSLGKNGLAELIEMNCNHAARFAERLNAAGYPILNEVVLNQVLVSFGDSDVTKRVIKHLQEEGTCWFGGTHWQGKTAMRISVSSWRTTHHDIESSLEAVLRIADGECYKKSG